MRLSSARVKFCQTPYANFETTSRFRSNFYIPLQFHERLCLCTILAKKKYTLRKRGPLKWQFLRLLSARIKFCQINYPNFERTTRLLSKFCIPRQFHERLFLCTFFPQKKYTLLKSSPLKWQSLRLLRARIKFCQIPYANFETASRLLSKFCIPFQFHERLFLCTFLAQTIYTLLKRSSFKRKFLSLSNARVKFCQISYANFEMIIRYLSKFSIPFHCHER